MANTFKVVTKAGVTSSDVIYTVAGSTTTVVLGVMVGNTTTGQITATISLASDTDLLTLASGILTVAGEVSMTTLDIGGTNVTSTAAELNILDGVTATATELNIMDGDTSATSTTLADADRLVTNDAGTMKQVALTDLKTYLTSAGFSSEDPTALAIALG